MAALLGLALGCGLFLLWWSLWYPPTEKPGAARPDSQFVIVPVLYSNSVTVSSGK